MTATERDEMGWPIRMLGDVRVCARPGCMGGTGHEAGTGFTYGPSDGFCINGYCSIECRDMHGLEEERDAAIAERDALRKRLEAPLPEEVSELVSWFDRRRGDGWAEQFGEASALIELQARRIEELEEEDALLRRSFQKFIDASARARAVNDSPPDTSPSGASHL